MYTLITYIFEKYPTNPCLFYANNIIIVTIINTHLNNSLTDINNWMSVNYLLRNFKKNHTTKHHY